MCGSEMQRIRIHHHALGCFHGTIYTFCVKTRSTYSIVVVCLVISLILNSTKNYIQLIGDLKLIRPIIQTMNMQLIHNCVFM
jgi:hypothetical protein